MNRHTRKARRIGVAAVGVAVCGVLVAGPASAAFTASGTAVATAKGTSVGAVTGASQTASTTTSVTIGWTGTAAPSTGLPVTYTVTRTGRTGNVCVTTSLSCQETGFTASTTPSTATYTITPSLGGWSGAVGTVANAGPSALPSTGTATKLRFTHCTSGTIGSWPKGSTFTSSVQLLNNANVLVADNPSAITITIAASGSALKSGPTPTTLTVPVNSSVTSGTSSTESTSANDLNSMTVTASAPNLASASCVITKG